MAGAWTTLSIKDAGGSTRTMRVWDESGAGTGPYSFGQVTSDGAGSSALSIGAGATIGSTPRMTLASDSPGIIATGSQASPSTAYLSSVVAGDIAAAASDSGNPVKIGGAANSAVPTKVTAGQRANAWIGLRGEQVAVGNTRENKGVTHTTITSSTAETTIIAAVASTFLDLYGLILANTGATTTSVTIKDSTAGTTRAIIEVPTLETRGFMLPVDSAIPQATVNNNWTATCGSSTASLEVTALWAKQT